MFSWEVFSNTTSFSDVEDKVIKAYLKILMDQCSRDSAFMRLLDINKLHFVWANNMSYKNGIMGAWSMMHGDNIYMQPYDFHGDEDSIFIPKKMEGKITHEQMHHFLTMSNLLSPNFAMTVVHELVHKFQYQTSPILYVINRMVTLLVDRIDYIERIGIEYDARKNSETPELMEFYKNFYEAFDYLSRSITAGPLDDRNMSWKCYCDMHNEEYYLGFNEYKSEDYQVNAKSRAAIIRKFHKLAVPLINIIRPGSYEE